MRPQQLALPSRQTFLHHSCRRIKPQSGFRVAHLSTTVVLSLPKLNFQILRRTYATRAVGERKGTLKDVQKQLRYSRPNTTLENYVKEIPESVYRMVDAMYDEITPEVKLLGGQAMFWGELCPPEISSEPAN